MAVTIHVSSSDTHSLLLSVHMTSRLNDRSDFETLLAVFPDLYDGKTKFSVGAKNRV